MYHGMNTPAFCILSPPGSGKTTVATAMAASLVKNRAVFKYVFFQCYYGIPQDFVCLVYGVTFTFITEFDIM